MGTQPAMTYGASVIGRIDTQFRQIRTMVGATMFTDTAQRSLTPSYLLEGGRKDPAHMIIRMPLLECTRAAWTKRTPLNIMQGATVQAKKVQASRAVRGPWW